MKIIMIFLLSFRVCANDYIIKDSERLNTKQIGDYLCWAATLEAISKFEGVPKNQIDFVFENSASPKDIIENNLNSMFLFMTKDIYINKYYSNYSIIQKNSIESILKQNIPIIFLANNHISIIVGFNESHYIIMDTDIGEQRKVIKNDLDFLDKLKQEDSVFLAKTTQ